MAITISFKEANVRYTSQWYEGEVFTNHNNVKAFKGTFAPGANQDTVIAQAVYDTFIALRSEVQASMGSGWTDDGAGNYFKTMTKPAPNVVTERTINTITPTPPTPQASTIAVRMFTPDGGSSALVAGVNAVIGGITTTGNTPLTLDVLDKQDYSVTITPPENYKFVRWGSGLTNNVRSGTYGIANGALSFTAYADAVEAPEPEQETVYEGIYIPAYWTPWNSTLAGYFDTIVAAKTANPDLPMIVAINPASGPGTSVNSGLLTKVQAMKAKGIKVIEYVGVNYFSELTKRQYPVGNQWPSDNPKTMADLKKEIDNAVAWYGVDGFMFDDFPNNKTITMPDGKTKEVYTLAQELATYARSKAGITYLKGNPGTRPDKDYFSIMDNLAVYESTTQPTVAQLQNITYNGEFKEQCTIVVHSRPTLDTSKFQEMSLYARYFYASDASYNALPAYFDSMITGLVAVT